MVKIDTTMPKKAVNDYNALVALVNLLILKNKKLYNKLPLNIYSINAF
jgi:hypothetical protein